MLGLNLFPALADPAARSRLSSEDCPMSNTGYPSVKLVMSRVGRIFFIDLPPEESVYQNVHISLEFIRKPQRLPIALPVSPLYLRRYLHKLHLPEGYNPSSLVPHPALSDRSPGCHWRQPASRKSKALPNEPKPPVAVSFSQQVAHC